MSIFTAFVVVSLAHIVSFVISIYLLLPFQERVAPDMASYASLLFLPHGVRVLSAWLLGWKAIPLFAPTALFWHWVTFGAAGFTIDGLIGVFSGIVCAVVTFWSLSQVGMDFRISSRRRVNWRDVLVAGAIASVINTFGMAWAFDHDMITVTGYFIGDVTGLFACMVLLMLFFRAERARQRPANSRPFQ